MQSDPHWLKWTFAALIVLFIVPAWSVIYIPTADGPAHLYNSWIINELIRGHDGPVARAFAIDWRPHPNWLGHAVMVVLMFIAPPIVAEKLLFTIIIVLFMVAVWMISADRVYAFIAFQFAYHQLLQTGFYNFSLSVGLYMLTLATWLRRKFVATALLLILCYFAHPLSAVLAIGSIGFLWLMTSRKPRELMVILPVIPLLIWFLRQRGTGAVVEKWPIKHLFDYIFQTEILVTFSERQMQYGELLMIAYVVFAILTFVLRDARRQSLRPLAFLTLILLLLYIWSPSTVAGGQLVRERLVLYIYLLPLAWFAPKFPARVRQAIAIVFVAAAIAKGAFTIERYRHYGREVTEYVRAYRPIKPGSTVLPLLFTRDTPGAFTGVVGHASGYASIERRLVDLDNYEPATGYFPTRYRAGFVPPDLYAIEAHPAELQIQPYVSRADAVFTWKMPDWAPVLESVRKYYRLAGSSGDGKVYERKAESWFAAGEKLQTILLPIAGSVRGAEHQGRYWRVDQMMRNRGSSFARLELSACPELSDCQLDLKPREAVRLSASEPFITVRARESDLLAFATTVLRMDGDRVITSASIPAVFERDFRAHRLTLNGVHFGPDTRINLRLWVRGAGGPQPITIRAGGAETRQFTDVNGYFTNGNLAALVDPHTSAPVRIECEAPEGTRIWAFVTETDNATERVVVHLPE